MTDNLPRVVVRDPNLPHQVVFEVRKMKLHISCNCLRLPGGRYESMGITDGDIKVARKLYNNPKNHWGPFGEEDEAKW